MSNRKEKPTNSSQAISNTENPEAAVDLLGAHDVFDAIELFARKYGRCNCAILDPWYNKGVGGIRDDYDAFLRRLLEAAASVADHIFLWGFPEIVAMQIANLPATHKLTAWLTWYYKNNPSVIRGWRSAQNACLHLSTPGAPLYPEHFLNVAQMQKLKAGKLRYMPGPPSVIEAPLNIGFVNRAEQTKHPAQKPMSVYEKIVRMATKPNDLVFDPMCGSGTTGVVCRVLGRRSVLSDINPEYVAITSRRLSDRSHDRLLINQLKGALSPA